MASVKRPLSRREDAESQRPKGLGHHQLSFTESLCVSASLRRNSVATLLALLSLSAVAIVSPSLAQSAPQRSELQPTGSARITGRVVASDNGAPVRRAQVRLSGVPANTQTAGPKRPYVQRDVETDDNGTFDFAGLPAGSYSVSVARTNGFLELARARQAVVG